MSSSDLPSGEWVPIEVAASFSGIRFLPWWYATSHNSANPLLEVGPAGIRYRAIILHEMPFARIEEVDLRTAWRTANLCFRFSQAVRTFSANVRYIEEARRALQLLNGSVPLGARAQAALAATEHN
jgi:hypothetical protein